MSTLKEKIEIMQRFEDGETVEWQLRETDPIWKEVTHPAWNWEVYEYRIKPANKEDVKPEMCSIIVKAWFDGVGIFWRNENLHGPTYIRVPKEDKLIEVPVQVFTTSIKGE